MPVLRRAGRERESVERGAEEECRECRVRCRREGRRVHEEGVQGERGV